MKIKHPIILDKNTAAIYMQDDCEPDGGVDRVSVQSYLSTEQALQKIKKLTGYDFKNLDEVYAECKNEKAHEDEDYCTLVRWAYSVVGEPMLLDGDYNDDMYYYHATPIANAPGISGTGMLWSPDVSKPIYFCADPIECIRFMAIYNVKAYVIYAVSAKNIDVDYLTRNGDSPYLSYCYHQDNVQISTVSYIRDDE